MQRLRKKCFIMVASPKVFFVVTRFGEDFMKKCSESGPQYRFQTFYPYLNIDIFFVVIILL